MYAMAYLSAKAEKFSSIGSQGMKKISFDLETYFTTTCYLSFRSGLYSPSSHRVQFFRAQQRLRHQRDYHQSFLERETTSHMYADTVLLSRYRVFPRAMFAEQQSSLQEMRGNTVRSQEQSVKRSLRRRLATGRNRNHARPPNSVGMPLNSAKHALYYRCV